jgi:hypothetical protein
MPSRKKYTVCRLLYRHFCDHLKSSVHFRIPGWSFLLRLIFDPEDGGNTFLRTIVKSSLPVYRFSA